MSKNYMVVISETHFIFAEADSPKEAAVRAMKNFRENGTMAYDSDNDIVTVEYLDDGEGTTIIPDDSWNYEK